jgi:squalene-hopene/tetraprenyl-beta-curcumene cyclase
MLPSRTVTGLDSAIARAQARLLSLQAPDGHWVGEVEADTTITSEQILLGHLLDRVNREREQRAVRYLRRRQMQEGGYNLYEGGPANLSATIKAYFAMKMAGVPTDDLTMRRARDVIHAMGGPSKANVFTKIQLALFGEYDWNGVPSMPVEIMLIPRPFFLFNIYEISYWSRTVVVPLLIIMDRKPVKWLPPELSLDELWPVPRTETSLRFSRLPQPFSWRGLFWKSFFIGVDDGLKIWERFSPRPGRKLAVAAAKRWIEERVAVPGGLGGIYPAMANAIIAMRLLGYADDHPLVTGQLKEIEALAIEDQEELHYQPCVSPVWDTALAANALVESGLPADHEALRRAGQWLLDKQVLVPGDWQMKRPHVQPGGWASSTTTTTIRTWTTPAWC